MFEAERPLVHIEIFQDPQGTEGYGVLELLFVIVQVVIILE